MLPHNPGGSLPIGAWQSRPTGSSLRQPKCARQLAIGRNPLARVRLGHTGSIVNWTLPACSVVLVEPFMRAL